MLYRGEGKIQDGGNYRGVIRDRCHPQDGQDESQDPRGKKLRWSDDLNLRCSDGQMVRWLGGQVAGWKSLFVLFLNRTMCRKNRIVWQADDFAGRVTCALQKDRATGVGCRASGVATWFARGWYIQARSHERKTLTKSRNHKLENEREAMQHFDNFQIVYGPTRHAV